MPPLSVLIAPAVAKRASATSVRILGDVRDCGGRCDGIVRRRGAKRRAHSPGVVRMGGRCSESRNRDGRRRPIQPGCGGCGRGARVSGTHDVVQRSTTGADLQRTRWLRCALASGRKRSSSPWSSIGNPSRHTSAERCASWRFVASIAFGLDQEAPRIHSDPLGFHGGVAVREELDLLFLRSLRPSRPCAPTVFRCALLAEDGSTVAVSRQ